MSDGLSFDLALDYPGLALHMAADLPGHGITALVGPSGAGKTTLLQAIAGLEPARGHVTLDGRPLHPLPAHKRGVAIVFQNARLFGHLDVAGNIAFGARRRGTPPDAVARIVDALDLHPLMDRAISRLSGGETRRVALARALAASPDLLLLDEPLSGLDNARRAEILPYLARAIRAADCPALFVTHDAGEALSLADRRLAVESGRIVETLPVPALLPLERDPATPRRARFGSISFETPHDLGRKERWALVLDPERTILCAGDASPLDSLAIPAAIAGSTDRALTLSVLGHRIEWPLTGPLPETHEATRNLKILVKTPLLRLLAV